MPSLADHTSASIAKLLFLGDSGAGKTGALASLAGADYKLRILDMDNGLDSLVMQIKQHYPNKLGNVGYETLRDKYKASPAGPVIDGAPKAFIKALELLDKWSDGTKPETWGPDHILVLDSLTFMSNAAMEWADVFKSSKDRRQVYGEAQRAVEHVIAMLTAESFRCNVIIIAHVDYIDRQDGLKKGFPTTVGKALSPKLPAYFNSVALCESVFKDNKVVRTVRTTSTSMIDLKNPASIRMAPSMPVETALADFFKTVKGK